MKGIFAILVTALAVSGLSGAQIYDYRVAGMIAAGNALWIAVLETPDGEQYAIRAGESLGEAVVLEISEQGVLLQLPNGERLMQVTGGGKERLPGLPAVLFRKPVEEAIAQNLLRNTEVLADLKRLGPRARVVGLMPMTGPEEQLLPVESVDDSTPLILETLSRGHGLRVMVEGDSNFDTVYLMPSGELVPEQPANE